MPPETTLIKPALLVKSRQVHAAGHNDTLRGHSLTLVDGRGYLCDSMGAEIAVIPLEDVVSITLCEDCRYPAQVGF